ncbi:hypothetical protein [Gorillibacterium sp. sgz5001074]|uniref:hypothetical protein n=1 Tax=Gorillibacterium sp. sgz5001074 TaxID=3446695 RepID=UPI003F66E342
MSTAPIYFIFPDKKAALLALDTLQEIGFRADMLEQRHPDHKPALQVLVDRGDITSALEITQAHGGRLCETQETQEPAVYTSAYNLDGIRIPAHTVTEDLPESYMNGGPAAAEDPEDREVFDPSGDDYDHFSAGVRL